MTKELLQDTNSVVKQRSSAACIKEGFRFITSHFRSLFHSAWAPVLVTALLMTVYFLFFIEMMVIPMPTDVSIGTMVIMYVSYVLYSLSGLLLTGRLFMLFKEFRDTGRVPRLKLTSGWKQTLKMAGRAFIFQIWIILLASIIYCLPKFRFRQAITGQIDDVNYADITDEQTTPENTEPSC